ncbi:MAG: hypothetical protein IBJ11_09420 [Phycisphaerales bacterium]|nr:hypothetical protein [Phycisphaerales bacterium]
MNSPAKSSNNLQAYRLILYRRALHPELFKVKGRRTVSHGEYEFEAWVMPGSHLLRFQHGPLTAVELITDMEDGVPDRGVLAALPCAGERDHEQAFSDKVKFWSTIQTEQLADNLYKATYNELVAFGKEQDALIHTWVDTDLANTATGGRCASILDMQRYRREIHVQAWHLIAAGGIVLRTQSMFEHAE